MSKNLLAYENFTIGTEDWIRCLFEDGLEVETPLWAGKGCWHRLVNNIRILSKREIQPGDFDETIEFLYYDYAREELRDQPDKMKQLGYFLCPQCNSILPKREFKSHNPCDNCLYTQSIC